MLTAVAAMEYVPEPPSVIAEAIPVGELYAQLDPDSEITYCVVHNAVPAIESNKLQENLAEVSPNAKV